MDSHTPDGPAADVPGPQGGRRVVAAGSPRGAVGGLGLDRERVVRLGFSQGTCIAAEYAARNPGASPVVSLGGSLLGPEVDPGRYAGDCDSTPVCLGVGAADPHIPAECVRATGDVLRALGADVAERVYDGVGREVTDDEFAWVDEPLGGIAA
jgi:phospholipase/carboxylesterase